MAEKRSMTYRVNRSSGDRVSLLGYGGMRWPVKKSEDGETEVIDQERVNQLIDRAIEAGVNYFDTSPSYHGGHSESAMGKALSRHPRESYFIATKMSNFDAKTHSREESIRMYNDSLKNLQTDHIDYMLLHAVGTGKNGMEEFEARFINNGILDFLLEEREAGRIRNLGFSYHGDINVFNRLLANHDKYKWDFVQIQLNYLDWHHANELNKQNTNAEYLYNELKKRGIQAVIMEPLLGGRLSNLPEHIKARLREKEPERSVASWAFRYAGSMENVLVVLSGMTYPEHLEDNIMTFAPFKPLNDKEREFLYDTADLVVKYPTVACNDCKYCLPCPCAVDIPEIFRYYNDSVNNGTIPQENSGADFEGLREAFVKGYDRFIPEPHRADKCVSCGKCMTHCPQNIKIPTELERINKIVNNG